jgi:hypothetical protein
MARPRADKSLLKQQEQKPVEAPVATKPVDIPISMGASELAKALIDAIQITKPVEKKNPFNRKVNTPWTPKDGSAKLKFKRRMFQHGIMLDEDFLTNEQIALGNKLKPGSYLDGHVRVTKRRDKGIDVSYPMKTAAQRLRLVNQFGIRDFTELLARIVDEQNNPKVVNEDEDDY